MQRGRETLLKRSQSYSSLFASPGLVLDPGIQVQVRGCEAVGGGRVRCIKKRKRNGTRGSTRNVLSLPMTATSSDHNPHLNRTPPPPSFRLYVNVRAREAFHNFLSALRSGMNPTWRFLFMEQRGPLLDSLATLDDDERLHLPSRPRACSSDCTLQHIAALRTRPSGSEDGKLRWLLSSVFLPLPSLLLTFPRLSHHLSDSVEDDSIKY